MSDPYASYPRYPYVANGGRRYNGGPMVYTNPLRNFGGRGSRAEKSFQAKNNLLYVQALSTENLPKDVRIKFLNTLEKINSQLARELQQLIADKLDSGRVQTRKGVSTGRLEKAILDRRNRIVSPTVMGVGRPDFLSQSQAKYWRSIELGTTQFVGNEIAPYWLWGQRISGRGRGMAPFTSIGADRSGKLTPMSRASARRALIRQGMTKADARAATGGPASVRIKRPIQAQYYFRRAWNDFNAEAKGRAAILTALREAGINPK